MVNGDTQLCLAEMVPAIEPLVAGWLAPKLKKSVADLTPFELAKLAVPRRFLGATPLAAAVDFGFGLPFATTQADLNLLVALCS